MKKILALLLSTLIALGFVACSRDEAKTKDTDNTDEIVSKYDDIVKDTIEDRAMDSSASVFGSGFTLSDMTFTSPDSTIAFSLSENSFAKFTPGGTFFASVMPGSEPASYEAGFKTGRGLSLMNLASDYISKYDIQDSNALYRDESGIYYNPRGGSFSGKLTAMFASNDKLSYTPLGSDLVQKFLSVRDTMSNGAYIEPQKITGLFEDYASIAVMDITADAAGGVQEFAMYRFDK